MNVSEIYLIVEKKIKLLYPIKLIDEDKNKGHSTLRISLKYTHFNSLRFTTFDTFAIGASRNRYKQAPNPYENSTSQKAHQNCRGKKAQVILHYQ